MRNAVNLLSEVMSSPDWSAGWMTIEEIAAEMERRGLWDQRPFRSHRGRQRLDYLAEILRANGMEEDRIWMQMGSRFKHTAILTDEDHALFEDWLEARRAAFDEDLSRILLGEPPLWRNGAKPPARGFRDLLRQARPLVEELSSYFQHDYRVEDEEIGVGETPPVARRMEELAVALTNLFDRSAEQSAEK
jgi:hypothetical protein